MYTFELKLLFSNTIFNYSPSTTGSIQFMYLESLAPPHSNSAKSMKQRVLFTKLKTTAEQNAARMIIHQVLEEHLMEKIKKQDWGSIPDNHNLNSQSEEKDEEENTKTYEKTKRVRMVNKKSGR